MTREHGAPGAGALLVESEEAGSSGGFDDLWWSTLIGRIADGNVVPVIGSGLFRFREAGREGGVRCFYRNLSERLAKRWRLPLPPNPPCGRQVLHDLVWSYHRNGGNERAGASRLENAYRDIAEECAVEDFPVPPALRQLAEIAGFRTYLTTMFADVVHRALKDQNREAFKAVFSPDFPGKPGTWKSKLVGAGLSTDLSQEILEGEDGGGDESGACQVFQLLGAAELEVPNSFVIWDNDLLNWAVALERNCPAVLDEFLRTKHLLILGLECGDWLTRFILRIANRGPLEYSGAPNYIADSGLTRDTVIYRFFESLGPARPIPVELGEDGLEWFVSELSKRWQAHRERRTRSVLQKQKPRYVLPSGEPPKKDFVFVSYSRKDDMDLAKEVVGVLESIGIEAWLDLKETPFGDQWKAKMRYGIDRCAYFLAIVSKAALDRDVRESYYLREWELADDRALNFGQMGVFCLVALAGGADGAHPKLPPRLRSGTHLLISRGGPWDEFKAEMARLWKMAGHE